MRFHHTLVILCFEYTVWYTDLWNISFLDYNWISNDYKTMYDFVIRIHTTKDLKIRRTKQDRQVHGLSLKSITSKYHTNPFQ